MKLKESVLSFVGSARYVPMTKDELARTFSIYGKERRDFYQALRSMEREGLLYVTKKGKIKMSRRKKKGEKKGETGRIQGNAAGYGFFIPDNPDEEDIFIPKERLHGAIHDDIVTVERWGEKGNGRRNEGRVLRILERDGVLVGTYYPKKKTGGYVIPDDRRYGAKYPIAKGKSMKAKTKDKVVVRVPLSGKKGSEAEIVDIIGSSGEKGLDISTIVAEYRLPDQFSPKALSEAAAVAHAVTEEERKGRQDFTELFTVTIDGADAKDFDDAISIERTETGLIRLYVHIADVAHYTRESSALDADAFLRGNSVYLLDRVLPMLPESLSNGICSLNPDEERLAMSVSMDVDTKGKVVAYKFYESYIVSNRRLIYDEVSDLLEGVRDIYGDPGLEETLRLMEELYLILEKKRKERGSIDFEFPEPRIILDEEGNAIDVQREPRRTANRIIEEFMLLTNETVGAHFGAMQEPFLYRIHENPDEMKVGQFQKILHNFGYHLNVEEIRPKDYQQIVTAVAGKPEETLIETLMLRSMKKARYSREPEIHFGLATKFYSHFTAPIRRYPDLVIHRILKKYLKGKLKGTDTKTYLQRLDRIAEHTSMTERRADEAEREVDDMKKAEYMSQFIGDDFEGTISGVTSFGFFVALDNTVEGFVSVRDRPDDVYSFDEENYRLVGERTGRTFELGMRGQVRLLAASAETRRIDFQWNGDAN